MSSINYCKASSSSELVNLAHKLRFAADHSFGYLQFRCVGPICDSLISKQIFWELGIVGVGFHDEVLLETSSILFFLFA